MNYSLLTYSDDITIITTIVYKEKRKKAIKFIVMLPKNIKNVILQAFLEKGLVETRPFVLI